MLPLMLMVELGKAPLSCQKAVSPGLALPSSLANQSALVARSPTYPKVTHLQNDLVAFREAERKIGV